MERVVDVKDKYSREISEIKNKLNQLESGRVYDQAMGNKMDGYLSTNIIQLRAMFNDLINKIEYNKDSITDEIAAAFIKFKI